MTLSAGTRLGPYEIVALLGAGGMGEVYRARDPKLQRDVAIKVLPESLARDAQSMARFEREALAVASLSHPNILAIHDFGTQDGVAYAVMELLEGETLRARLATGPVPPKQAVDFAVQIAKGLSAAHEKGVVHRDLKPENIFVSPDGHVKILDFGLAKRTEAVAQGKETSAPTDTAFTTPGTVMGTVGYMSPEQVRGLAVDQRSDIFSFGTVLYETVSGIRPFQRDTFGDTLAAILKEEPAELMSSGRNVSPALDHVIRHCLEKDPKNRFQSARDIAFALSEASSSAIREGRSSLRPRVGKKTAAVIAALFVSFAAATIIWRRSHPAPSASGGLKRMAVLPFENLGAPENEYVADGIADEIRGKLTALPSIRVIARASSTPYKKTTKTPKQIAEELDVGYLLTATVRWEKSGGMSRVQVSPELTDVSGSGAPTSIWQQPFDAALTDVFQVQADIASRVAKALGVVLRAPEERRLEATPTSNLAAYEAFLKGEDAFRNEDNEKKALGFYEQAVALDPRFQKAWAALGWASSWMYGSETPTPELRERAYQSAEKAVALAPDAANGYLALGSYFWLVARDLNQALETLNRGLRLAPGDADLMTSRGGIQMTLGRWEDALKDFRQGERLDPRSPDPKIFLGIALGSLRRYREAGEVLDQGLALAPRHLSMIGTKANWFLDQGDLAGARAVLQTAPKDLDPTTLVAFKASFVGVWVLDESESEMLVRLTPGAFHDPADWGLCLAAAYALRGDAATARQYAEEAKRTLEEQILKAPQFYLLHGSLGQALAYLGRKEEAIREGERSIALAPAKEGPAGVGMQTNLAQIYAILGESEKAIDKLESLLKLPGGISPGRLKINPTYDRLRDNPRFRRLVAGAA